MADDNSKGFDDALTRFMPKRGMPLPASSSGEPSLADLLEQAQNHGRQMDALLARMAEQLKKSTAHVTSASEEMLNAIRSLSK